MYSYLNENVCMFHRSLLPYQAKSAGLIFMKFGVYLLSHMILNRGYVACLKFALGTLWGSRRQSFARAAETEVK